MFPFSRRRGEGGFAVGEVLRISCAAAEARVARVTSDYVMLAWPWGGVDPDSVRVRWDGTRAFPREPDHPEWHNTPWRIEADDVRALNVADVCGVGIPLAQVRVRAVRSHRPPADLGRLPRPELTLSVVFLGDEQKPAAGFDLPLPCAEPLVVEHRDAP